MTYTVKQIVFSLRRKEYKWGEKMVVSVWKLVSICLSSFSLGLGTASLVVSLVNYSSLKKRDKKRRERDSNSDN